MKGAAKGAAIALLALATRPLAASSHQVDGVRVQLMQLISLPLFSRTLGKEKPEGEYGGTTVHAREVRILAALAT